MSERPPDDRPPRPADDLGEPDPFEVIERRSGLDTALLAILVGSLVVWVLSEVATGLLFREAIPAPPAPLVVLDVGTRPHFVALFVQELAFRVWVAAAVLLVVRWARSRGVLGAEPDDRG